MTMSRFFNITTSDDGTSTIFLYGDIGDYTEVQSGRIAQELMEAERVSRRIHVRINSNGGEVYSGIAIFNALRHSQADIRIYVDGIAASMASVIALCGKPVEMSKYARLMLHSVSGGCYGNKQDLQRCMEEIESLEGSLSEIYAERLGMSQEEVRQTYFDGEDHWLTAQEALDLGFIDGIYDADPVPADSTPAQIYTLFNNRLIEPQKNREDMNLEDVKKRPRFKDCASDADVFRLMDQLEEEAGKVPILTKENTDLKAKVKTYEDKAAAEDLAAYLQEYTECTDWEIRRKMRMEALVKFMTLRSLATRGKISQAVDFIRTFLDSGKKLIVFCSLHEIVDELQKVFPRAVTVTGRDSAVNKQASVDAFQNNPNVQLIICSIKAAGVGLTLTAASDVAFIELAWTYADCCQCEDRAHRIGQKDNVTCYYLLGRGTIDHTIYSLIHRKKSIANEIMNADDEIPTDEMYFDELVKSFLNTSG